MEIARVLLAVVLFGAALWSVRLAAGHIRNLVGHTQRINASLDAVEKGEMPPYPLALADHLNRVAEKGPAAVQEKVRWDWVGMATVGVAVATVLTVLGVWVWP